MFLARWKTASTSLSVNYLDVSRSLFFILTLAAKAVIVEELDPDIHHTARLLVPGPPPLPIEERSALFSAPSTG